MSVIPVDPKQFSEFIDTSKIFDKTRQLTYIEAAYNHLQVISQDDKKRMEYEARQKAIRDYNEGMLESHERGLRQGRVEGRAEGLMEGERKKSIDIAKKLLAMGLDLDTVSKGTGLTVEQIQKL